MIDTEERNVMTDVEAGKFIGVAPQTMRNWRCQRRGPAYLLLGRSVRYLKSDLEAYLEKNRIAPESN
jgi:hypothetical protein